MRMGKSQSVTTDCGRKQRGSSLSGVERGRWGETENNELEGRKLKDKLPINLMGQG